MKKIKVGKCDFALVDEEDFEILSKHKWALRTVKTTKYAITAHGKRSTISMHRLLLNPEKGMDIDHINNNGLDNRRSNLRICTRSQNLANSMSNLKRPTKFKGVCKQKIVSTYEAAISFKNKKIRLGSYKTPEEAAFAYDKAAVKYFGDFALTNQKLYGNYYKAIREQG